MTLTEVKTMLNKLDIGVKYRYSKKKLSTPFLTYYRSGFNPFHADGITYYSSYSIIIELYLDEIDIEIEKKLEILLKEHELTWEKNEEWITSENMYQITYEIEV